MGKLNYTNRKIDGLKLGQVVNKDLIKRIPPHAASKAAFRDPGVDLDVSGKALADEGFFEIASALTEGLNHDGVQGRCLRLEELCLKENQLSVSSLGPLTPIIRLAWRDLRDLDLSNNGIAIKTRDEAALWEAFLMSFKQCCSLRRIDLSGNPLGPRGFEILLRVYAKERPLDLTLPYGLDQDNPELQSLSGDCTSPKLRKLSVTSEPEEFNANFGDGACPQKRRPSCHVEAQTQESSGRAESLESLVPIHATTRGLRSVPYVVLSDTAMNETCALHLSYIIEGHHTPRQLLTRVPPAKAGLPAQQIVTYDESHCRGIVYYANSQLGTAGLKVLELAEKRRNHLHGKAEETDEADPDPSAIQSESSKPSRRASGPSSRAIVVTRARRRRSSQTGSLDQVDEGADLDRARSRIQGDTLHEAGPCSNDLWRTALRLLALGREIQTQRDKNPMSLSTSSPPPTAGSPKPKGSIVKTLTIPAMSKPKTLKPLTPLVLEQDFNRPMNPWNINLGKNRNGIPSTPNVIPPTPLSPKAVSQKQLGAGATQKDPPATVGEKYRSKLPCGFPEYAWVKILGHVADADGIMSDDQQLSILRYAMDRSTLSKECEALGLTLATQIWRTLEATGCLTYEMDI